MIPCIVDMDAYQAWYDVHVPNSAWLFQPTDQCFTLPDKGDSDVDGEPACYIVGIDHLGSATHSWVPKCFVSVSNG